MAGGPDTVVRHLGTSEEFSLPLIELPLPWHERRFAYLCHDPVRDRYKILSCSKRFRISFWRNAVDARMRYATFTLGADVAWRDLHRPGLYQLGRLRSVCIDGVLYLTNISTSYPAKGGVIAAYVVGEEYFDVVKYHTKLSPSRYGSCHLVKLKGAVAVVDIDDGFKNCEMRLWVRRGLGLGFGFESWWSGGLSFLMSGKLF